MINQKVSVHAIINPISGVGSKRAIPRMIEKICSRNDHALTISFTEYRTLLVSLVKVSYCNKENDLYRFNVSGKT